MRKIGIVLFFMALLNSCEDIQEKQTDNYKISDGCYTGYFEYHDTSYWCSICLENGKFMEWPSGGARFQKSMSCLTTGTYSTRNNTLTFVLESYKFKDFAEPCIEAMFLPGNYEISNTHKIDSFIFKKGIGDNQITYFLKKNDTGDH